MKTRNLILFVLTAVVCGAFLCTDSYAKVCFLGEDCGTGADFGNHEKIGENLDELCKKEGYTIKVESSSSVACGANQIEYKCPYNAKWRMCCGADYTYQQCGAGLISKGVCGGKHKCECDTSLFPYKQLNATTCSKYNGLSKYENSLASGASCVYSSLESGTLSMMSRFEKCMCDRGLYPKPASECEEGGAAGAGIKCTDSDGNNFYQTCECNYSKYPILATTCEFGTYTSDTLCQEGALFYAPKCCECTLAEYPYRSSPDTSKVKEWVSCKSREHCTGGGAVFRATKCQKGYKLSGGECVPVSCDEAVQIYLGDNVSNDGYAVLKYDGAYKAVKTTSDGEDHYSWQKVNDAKARTYIVTGNITVSSEATTTCANSVNKCKKFYCTAESYGGKSYSGWTSDCTCENCCKWVSTGDSYREPYDPYDPFDNNNGLGDNYEQIVDKIETPTTSGYYSCSASVGCSGTCDPSKAYYDKKVCKETESHCTSYNFKGIADVPSNGSSETYISALKYLSAFSTSAINKDAGLKAMQRSCTVNPTLTYSASSFPVSSEGDRAPTMNFNGVNLKFSSTTTSNRPIVIDDGDLYVYDLTQKKPLTVNGGNVSGYYLKNATGADVTLTAKSGATPKYTVKYSTFNSSYSDSKVLGKFKSTKYDFDDVAYMKFSTSVTGDYSVADITLREGGSFRSSSTEWSKGILIYPSADAKNSTYSSYVSIIGPSSSTGAKVYSNLHAGTNYYDEYKMTKGMSIRLSKNVSFEILDGYLIGVSPSSYVHATDFGAGTYNAKINWSTSNTAWKKCTGSSVIYQAYNNGDISGCWETWEEQAANSEYYFATTINAQQKRTFLAFGKNKEWYQTRMWPWSDCPTPGSRVNYSTGLVEWSSGSTHTRSHVSCQ